MQGLPKEVLVETFQYLQKGKFRLTPVVLTCKTFQLRIHKTLWAMVRVRGTPMIDRFKTLTNLLERQPRVQATIKALSLAMRDISGLYTDGKESPGELDVQVLFLDRCSQALDLPNLVELYLSFGEDGPCFRGFLADGTMETLFCDISLFFLAMSSS